MLTAVLVVAALVEPTSMTKRAIPGSGDMPPGTTREIKVGGLTGTLFTPPGWAVGGDRSQKLRIHVHTVPWYIAAEHARAELREPLLIMNFGAGSVTYSKPFESASALPEWLRAAERALGLRKQQRFDRLQVTSFSAGYGAVRQWMSQPGNRMLLRRVIMCDSFYGSLDPGAGARTPLREHVGVWEAFARDAMAGRCTFVITNSRIQPESYCGTFEIANGLVASLGGAMRPALNEAATKAPDYPLLERFDRGHLYVWNYAGTDAPAHTVHIRHIPTTWAALDAAGAP